MNWHHLLIARWSQRWRWPCTQNTLSYKSSPCLLLRARSRSRHGGAFEKRRTPPLYAAAAAPVAYTRADPLSHPTPEPPSAPRGAAAGSPFLCSRVNANHTRHTKLRGAASCIALTDKRAALHHQLELEPSGAVGALPCARARLAASLARTRAHKPPVPLRSCAAGCRLLFRAPRGIAAGAFKPNSNTQRGRRWRPEPPGNSF